DLLERDLHRLLEVAAFDEPAEAGRAGDVRALADHDERRVLEDPERLQSAQPRHGLRRRDMSRGLSLDRGRNGLDVFGRGAAAAADDVDEAVLRELAQVAARVVRLLV